MQYREILNKFRIYKSSGNQAKCICPNHNDKQASLSVCYNPSAKKTLIYCQAGCETIDVLKKVNLNISDLVDTQLQKVPADIFYTIAQISDLIGLSKVSIYKKLKLKELKEHISKKFGITYVDEVGFNLIKYGLKNDFKEKEANSTLNNEVVLNTEELSFNKEVFKLLKEQLNEKNIQIHELHKLIENNQVLLKEKPQQDALLLEEHFQDLDTKLMDIRDQMEEHREPQKGFLKRLFKK